MKYEELSETQKYIFDRIDCEMLLYLSEGEKIEILETLINKYNKVKE